jgi:catalase
VQPPQGPTVPLRVTAPEVSPALSMTNLLPGNIMSRKVAILVANGVDGDDVDYMMAELKREGASAKLLGPSAAPVKTASGVMITPHDSMEGLPSVIFDAVFIPGGEDAARVFITSGTAVHYVLEAYKHLKAIAICGEACELTTRLALDADAGLITGRKADEVFANFAAAIANHRVWEREDRAKSIPA